MQIPWKPNGLEAKDPKKDFGFTSKIMQIPWKPGGLEDQDPNSYISKITFVSWIRGFCGQLSHPWSVHLDVDRSWSVLKRNFCNFNPFWRLLTFSDNCANLTFFHFHNSVGDCKQIRIATTLKFLVTEAPGHKPPQSQTVLETRKAGEARKLRCSRYITNMLRSNKEYCRNA